VNKDLYIIQYNGIEITAKFTYIGPSNHMALTTRRFEKHSSFSINLQTPS